MLVLSRKVGEQIVIDGDIVVTIVSVEGNKVRLGISAPPSCRVDRAEVHQRHGSKPANRGRRLRMLFSSDKAHSKRIF